MNQIDVQKKVAGDFGLPPEVVYDIEDSYYDACYDLLQRFPYTVSLLHFLYISIDIKSAWYVFRHKKGDYGYYKDTLFKAHCLYCYKYGNSTSQHYAVKRYCRSIKELNYSKKMFIKYAKAESYSKKTKRYVFGVPKQKGGEVSEEE